MTNLIKIALSILFIGCLFEMPYGYFQFVRFLGMVGFAVLAFEMYEKDQTWFIVWLASAVLINPLIKISLGREIWNIVDVIWVVLLVFTVYQDFQKKS